MKTITVKQLKKRLQEKSIKVLDVRTKEKFEKGRLVHKRAENINVFKEEIFKLEIEPEAKVNIPFTRSEEVVVTCTTGNSAKRCSKILSDLGYNVLFLEGGMKNWQGQNK